MRISDFVPGDSAGRLRDDCRKGDYLMDNAEKWAALDKRLVELSGEGLAAIALATVALDAIVASQPAPARRSAIAHLEKTLDAFVSQTAMVRGEKGPNEEAREIARARITTALANIQRHYGL